MTAPRTQGKETSETGISFCVFFIIDKVSIHSIGFASRKDIFMNENDNFKRFSSNSMIEIGQRIQQKRTERGIKAIDMSEMLGICKDQYSRIETGKVVCKLDYLYVIAQILDVSTDYLIFGYTGSYETIISKLEMASPKTLEKISRIISVMVE